MDAHIFDRAGLKEGDLAYGEIIDNIRDTIEVVLKAVYDQHGTTDAVLVLAVGASDAGIDKGKTTVTAFPREKVLVDWGRFSNLLRVSKPIPESLTFEADIKKKFARRHSDGGIWVVVRRFDLEKGQVEVFGMRSALAELGETAVAGTMNGETSEVWTDSTLKEFGCASWPLLKDCSNMRPTADRFTLAFAVARTLAHEEVLNGADEGMVFFSICWADAAYQKIVTTHKYAAALMCTKVDAAATYDLKVSWKTFVVVVPDNLLPWEGAHIDRLLVNINPRDGAVLLNLYSYVLRRSLVVCMPARSILSPDEKSAGELGTSEQRVILMARRLLAGLLLAMEHTDNFQLKKGGGKGKRVNGREEPPHRTAFVGREIKVDCRLEVARYLRGDIVAGKEMPATVQMLVRGHYKRQVIGVGRKGRKVIWVEPYWKGPEDALILTHPYKVG